MIGLAMLAVFAVCAGLMAARILPALLAVPLMALGIAALAGVGVTGLETVLADGSVRLAPVMATVIFGALLSRVTMQTGIAETIVAYAAEFGGDEPLVVAFVMSAVVAALFTSLWGLGAIIMVGSIVLPIMMTVGVPRKTAATAFLLAFALGAIFNISQWTFYTETFHVERTQLQPFALTLALIDAVVLVIFLLVSFRRSRGYATWTVPPDQPVARHRVPPYALLAPLLPIVLYFAFHLNPIVAFAVAALYGAVAAQPARTIETLVASAIRGVEDVAPALLLFIGIGMLLVATNLPPVHAALAPVVAAVAPRSPLAYVILFGLGSPLALYRGPLNPYGVGIGVYTVLAGLGILPPVTLVAAVMSVVQVQNPCDPTNTQNVWVANFAGAGVDETARAALPYQIAVATLGVACVALFGSHLLGGAPFGVSPLRAMAATLDGASPLPGLYAPPAAARTVGITAADSPGASLAAKEYAHQIGRGWTGFRVVDVVGDPAAHDCADKPYAAIVRATNSGGGALGGDVGLQLLDCAGWPVDEWYAPAGASSGDVRRAAFGLVIRLRTWMLERPAHATALFEHGLAYDPAADGPTYLYSLFKTIDGEMRAFVRPGGPAYRSGMRTNDIVEKLDGLDWWEYGTYPTQRRAYDGQPHVFVLRRGAREFEVRLGKPLARQ